MENSINMEKGARIWISQESLKLLEKRLKQINPDYYIQRSQGHHIRNIGFNVNEAILEILNNIKTEDE